MCSIELLQLVSNQILQTLHSVEPASAQPHITVMCHRPIASYGFYFNLRKLSNFLSIYISPLVLTKAVYGCWSHAEIRHSLRCIVHWVVSQQLLDIVDSLGSSLTDVDSNNYHSLYGEYRKLSDLAWDMLSSQSQILHTVEIWINGSDIWLNIPINTNNQ